MLVVMNKDETSEEIDAVVAVIEKLGYTARPIPGGERVSIGILYNKGSVETSTPRYNQDCHSSPFTERGILVCYREQEDNRKKLRREPGI
jgi:hypothetical protein